MKFKDYINELNKSKFEKQITQARKDKNRLASLKSTIQDMGGGGMLSKNDVEYLIGKINKIL